MKIVQILLSCMGIVIGFFVFQKPQETIAIQKKFYENINWRMEPISMPKEIKSTKLMGFFLFSFTIITLVYSILR